MSERYVAKKYVTVGSVTNKTIECPNCHRRMTIASGVLRCFGTPNCKLQDVAFREVKSLTTIERSR